jgi:hypothetical protein
MRDRTSDSTYTPIIGTSPAMLACMGLPCVSASGYAVVRLDRATTA